MITSGSISISAPMPQVKQPTQGDGYMIVARDLLQGVEALSTLPPNVSPRSCALIAAHTLECALKAFLWHKEKNNSEHDLLLLWDMAYKEGGLGIPQVPPGWVRILSDGHGPNYVFRYQTGKGATKKGVPVFNLMQTPALIPMANELKRLIEAQCLPLAHTAENKQNTLRWLFYDKWCNVSWLLHPTAVGIVR